MDEEREPARAQRQSARVICAQAGSLSRMMRNADASHDLLQTTSFTDISTGLF